MPENHLPPINYGVASTFSIRKHPLHPVLVGFPITFLTSSLVTDLLFWARQAPRWADFSFWLILVGWVSGLLAVTSGLIEFLTIPRARSLLAGWLHFLLADLAIFVTTFNLILRIPDHQTGIVFTGIIYSASVFTLLAAAGFLGGRLVYRYLIGVYGSSLQGRERGE